MTFVEAVVIDRRWFLSGTFVHRLIDLIDGASTIPLRLRSTGFRWTATIHRFDQAGEAHAGRR